MPLRPDSMRRGASRFQFACNMISSRFRGILNNMTDLAPRSLCSLLDRRANREILGLGPVVCDRGQPSNVQDHVLALIALDRASSHLAEQIAVKSFVPVIAISSDHALTTTNIPWIFRLPERTSPEQALKCLSAAIAQAGSNRSRVREILASGKSLAGVRFASTGEVRQ